MEYTIAAGKTTAQISSLGAQLISLKDADGTEYIWRRDPAYWGSCAPVLFPIVGRLRDGKVLIEGEQYTMNNHGFAKESVFEVEQKDDSFICFLLRSSEATLACYPYAFELRVSFQLTEEGLTVGYAVRNTDKRTILFGIGAHPAINCPLGEDEAFTDYELRFEYPESVLSPALSPEGIIMTAQLSDPLGGRDVLKLDYSLFSVDAIILEGLRSRVVTLQSRKSGRGVRFSFPSYPTIAFWTPPGKSAPFLCLEPWFGMGVRDDETSMHLADKKGIVRLPEGEDFSAAYAVQFL